MDVAEIISAVQQVGATLRVEGEYIVAHNANRIAPAIKAAIRERKPELIAALVAEPSLVYRATSAEPGGTVCKVEIVELPQAERYRKVFAFLQLKPPALVDVARWRQCVEDGKHFLAKWGEQAESLGWTSADLFGLHTPPERPHPSYQRLSRYDCAGLCWLLEGREVVALTADTAAIENPTGNITVYRKHNKPALGPVGDSQAPSTSGTRFQKTEMPTLDALDARCACNSAGPAACRFLTPRQTS